MASNATSPSKWPGQDNGLMVNFSEYLSVYTPQFANSAAFGIFVCVFDIFLALTLLLLLLASPKTRQPFIYHQVCGMVVCDLLFCSLVDPLTVYIERGPWLLGAATCTSWHFLDNLLPFVTLVALLTTSADRLTFALDPRRYHVIFQRPGWRAAMLLLPWGLGMVIMAPIWLLGSTPQDQVMAGACTYSISNEANTASAVVSLFLPTLVVVLVTVLLLSTIVVGLPSWPEARGRAYVYSGLGKGLDGHSLARRHRGVVMGLCLCNFCSITMQLPYGVLAYMQPGCTEPSSCHSVVQMFQGLSWMRSLVVGARCITWLLTLKPPCPCAARCDRHPEGRPLNRPPEEAELQILTSRRLVSGSSCTTFLPCSLVGKAEGGACPLSLSSEAPPSRQVTSPMAR